MTKGASTFGGVAGFEQATTGVRSSGLLAAVAGRYVHDISERFDVLGEAGV